MKKIFWIMITTLLLLSGSQSICYSDNTGLDNKGVENQVEKQKEVMTSDDYDETKSSIDKYIDGQLDKVDLDGVQNYIDEEGSVKGLDLKVFIKDLIQGKKNILDLFDKDQIKLIMFKELKSSLKVATVILVLALFSSILKSLDNSFSTGAISKITTYIVFITMVSVVLIGFKDVLEISYKTIDSTIGLMQVIMPILMTLLILIGLPITSTALNPIFIGGVTLINIVFKKFMFLSITLAFGILIINNLSTNIKLKKLSSFIKQVNIASIGAIFTVYLGLVSIQGLYVTSFDKFSIKTAKFAIGNFIPVVGGFVSDSVDILISSSQLIKNVFGGVGLVILVGICLIPIIKIVSIIVVYKLAAIAVEPVGEEGISTFLNEVANLMIVMLACIIAIMIMFFVTIAILTSLSVVTQG